MGLTTLDKATLALLFIGIAGVTITGFSLDSFFPIYRAFPDELPVHPELVRVFEGTNPKAPVHIVEFGDYQCPNTKEQHGVLQQILTTYSDRINFVHKDFPLNIHPDSRRAAQAALCIKTISPSKHAPYEDMLFANQARLSRDDLTTYATTLGVDADSFSRCLNDPSISSRIQKDFDTAILEGLRGTPTLFINGKPLEGFQPYGKLKLIIESQLEENHAPNS